VSQQFPSGVCDRDWARLRADVKNCGFTTCDRNKKKLPVFFYRKKDTLRKIRFVFVSQEPAAKLRDNCNDNAEKIEEKLIEQCREGKGIVPHRIADILSPATTSQSRGFDPTGGESYWTHCLKCIPDSDEDIRNPKHWNDCAPLCERHFKREIQLIPSETLVLIPLGNYALAMCRHLSEDMPWPDPKGITKYIRTHVRAGSEEVTLHGKRVRMYPFLHPANRARNLTGDLRKIEESFENEIQKERNEL
jgi:uracil-DNA glycosylase